MVNSTGTNANRLEREQEEAFRQRLGPLYDWLERMVESMARSWRPHKPWKEYPLRVCRWMNDCQICKEPIRAGEQYYDGGYSLRVHKKCVDIGERHKLIDT